MTVYNYTPEMQNPRLLSEGSATRRRATLAGKLSDAQIITHRDPAINPSSPLTLLAVKRISLPDSVSITTSCRANHGTRLVQGIDRQGAGRNRGSLTDRPRPKRHEDSNWTDFGLPSRAVFASQPEPSGSKDKEVPITLIYEPAAA